MILDRAVAAVVPRLPRQVVGKVARRYISGETLESAIQATRELNARDVLVRSVENRVAFVPGGSFFPNGGHENTMRLNFSNTPVHRITDDDIGRPAEWRSSVLACDEVREALSGIAAFGFHDLVRPFHPQGGVFSWWDYRGGAFHRGQGLRIDFLLATPPLMERVRAATIDRDYRKKKEGLTPSDHAPVWMDLA